MNYNQLFKNKQHTITIRHRDLGYAEQKRNWNDKLIKKLLSEQDDVSDIYITKYPKNRLVECIILDFDSEDDISIAENCAKWLRNQLSEEGLNSVLVKSGNKGYHLYIQIAPVLFADAEDDMREVTDWNKFFNDFVDELLAYSLSTEVDFVKHDTLDAVNTSAGLGGNIRLIGSKHPVTHERCEIIEGSFIEVDEPTDIEDHALRYAHKYRNIVKKNNKKKLRKVKLEGYGDPIACNDLREVLPEVTGNEIKVYDRGYGYMKCPWHNDNKPSLLVTKEWFSCSACGEKGNIWTLRKKGLVEFDEEGKII